MMAIGWGIRFHSVWNKTVGSNWQYQGFHLISKHPQRRGFLVVISEDAFFKCLIRAARRALLAVLYFSSFHIYFSARLDFPSPPLSAPWSPRMGSPRF